MFGVCFRCVLVIYLIHAPPKSHNCRTEFSAVVIIPPEELCAGIQKLRAAHDKAYARWMPHINLMWPFVDEVCTHAWSNMSSWSPSHLAHKKTIRPHINLVWPFVDEVCTHAPPATVNMSSDIIPGHLKARDQGIRALCRTQRHFVTLFNSYFCY